MIILCNDNEEELLVLVNGEIWFLYSNGTSFTIGELLLVHP